MLVKKLVYTLIAATNANLNFVLLHSRKDALGTEFINARTLSHKHHLESATIRVVIDVLSDFHVNWVVFDRHVDSHP